MLSRHTRWLALPALVSCSLLAVPAAAEERVGVTPTRGRPTPEAFRADLVQLVDVLRDIAVMANDSGRRGRLERAGRLAREISPEALAEFLDRGGFSDLEPVLRANVRLRSLLRQRAERAGAGVQLESADLPGRPAILGSCDDIAHDSAFTFGALIAAQVADEALAASGRACDEVIVAAGFGGNTALVCLPLEIALQAAKVPFALADFCGGEEDSSYLEGSYDRLEHINNDLLALDAAVAGLAEAIAELEALVNGNGQRLKTLQAGQKQIMRLLLTPEGRRAVEPSVLTCTGDDCPNVLACPGPECSFPVK